MDSKFAEMIKVDNLLFPHVEVLGFIYLMKEVITFLPAISQETLKLLFVKKARLC